MHKNLTTVDFSCIFFQKHLFIYNNVSDVTLCQVK